MCKQGKAKAVTADEDATSGTSAAANTAGPFQSGQFWVSEIWISDREETHHMMFSRDERNVQFQAS